MKKCLCVRVGCLAGCILLLISIVAVSSAIPSSNKTTTEKSSSDSWPMFHSDPMHSGYSISTAPDTGNVIWHYTTGGAIQSSHAIVSGKVFVGSNDGKVYCWDESTGTPIWEYTTGGAVISSPAVVNGRVFIGSSDYNLYCLNATSGTKIWNFTAGWKALSSPTVVDGRVFFGSGCKVYSLRESDGSINWEYDTQNTIWRSSPVVANGKVFIAAGVYVYCLSEYSGTLKWMSDVIGSVEDSIVTVSGRKLFVGAPFSKPLHCLSTSDGSIIWEEGKVYSGASPAVANDKVFVGGNIFYCFDEEDGSTIWSYVPDEYITSSPAVADGKVYFGSDDGTFYCFDDDGTDDGTDDGWQEHYGYVGPHESDLIWLYYTGGSIRSSPAIANAKVFVGSDDGKIYCFATTSPYPALSISVTPALQNIPSGKSSEISVRVTNKSSNEPLPNVTIRLFLSAGSLNISYGKTDSNGEFACTFTAPIVSSQTTCRITAQASKSGYRSYSGGAEVIINPPPSPDLTVSSSDIIFSLLSPMEGESVTITATIYNTGEVDAFNIIVRFCYDTTSVEDKIIPSIPTGESYQVEINWSAIKGTHTIKVMVDPEDIIPESDENNNIATKDITVKEKEQERLAEAKPPEIPWLYIIIPVVVVIVVAAVALGIKRRKRKVVPPLSQ